MNLQKDECQFSDSFMQRRPDHDEDIERLSRKNKERCAKFIAKMIEKYGREVLKEIEEGKTSDKQPLQK